MSSAHLQAGPGGSGPLFVVGCGRSGTTLLRLMLTAHPDLSIPEESHYMYDWFRRRAKGRGPTDITSAAGWGELTDFVLEHPRTRHLGLDAAVLRRRCDDVATRSHAAAFAVVLSEAAAREGKPRWGDKTPQHVQYMLVLAEVFPDARFVHLVRDGRDTSLSLLSLRKRRLSRWGPRSMGHAGYYWAWLVLSGLLAGQRLGPERYLQLRFEDLVAAPEDHLRPLCAWAGLPFHDGILSYHESETTRAYAQAGDPRKRWLTRPPDPDRTDRWKQDMSPDDQASLLRQAGGLLAHLGYEVGALSTRQERLRGALRTLQADGPDPGERSASPHRVRGRALTAALLLDRARQVAALRRGSLDPFAGASLRWQRTLALLLAEAEGRA